MSDVVERLRERAEKTAELKYEPVLLAVEEALELLDEIEQLEGENDQLRKFADRVLAADPDWEDKTNE